jgi:dual specificity tyrosine-phosphorylation-regulated kinase 2/3/4
LSLAGKAAARFTGRPPALNRSHHTPQNILLTQPNAKDIRIIDFGSSCFEYEKSYTYIQSRFYRSPEVILGLPYGPPIDMWSFACILAELYTGVPIFPGENELDQLGCIIELRGLVPTSMVEQSSRSKLFFNDDGSPKLEPNSRGKTRRPRSKTLAQALKCKDEKFLSFLDRCLQWDPALRLTPSDALEHEWLTGRETGGRAVT